MNLRLCGLSLPVFAALLAGGSPAPAATFQYSSYSVAPTQYSISISQPNNVSGGVGEVVLHGAGANAGQNLAVFCMDVYTYLLSSGTYTVSPLTTAGTGGSNPTLTAAQINEIGSLIVHGSADIAAGNLLASAATQLAIWKIEYSNFAYTLSGSNVAGVQSLVATYLGNVMGGIWSGGSYDVQKLTLAHDQTMVYVTPIPGAFTLFATGLTGLVLLGRRKKRKDAAAIAAA